MSSTWPQPPPTSVGSPSAATQIRGTLHYGVSATGVPNAWQFYHVADSATQEDQDTFLSASIDNQTMPQFHNSVRYGLSRKREQYNLWQQRGSGYFDPFGSTLGQLVTITGANGYSATGRAVLDYAGTYPQGHQLVSNRDQLLYQGDYRITPHLSALAGFHFEDERGAEPGSTYYLPIERTNYDYLASVHGDFKNRFFYTLGGSLEHYSLFGTQTTPRAGSSFYALRPRKGVFSGTRILFNYGDAVREPALTDQEDSLYSFLIANGGQSTIRQLHLSPLSAPTARTYEGGGEQSFLSQRIVFRVIYFHNEFGRQIEYVGPSLIPLLLPNLTPAEQNLLQQFLQQSGAYSLTVNTEAFRAQGHRIHGRRRHRRQHLFARRLYLSRWSRAALLRQRQPGSNRRTGANLRRHTDRRHFAVAGSASVPPPSAYRLPLGQLRQPPVYRPLYLGICQPQRRLHLS